jgi:hypothetical protein
MGIHKQVDAEIAFIKKGFFQNKMLIIDDIIELVRSKKTLFGFL